MNRRCALAAVLAAVAAGGAAATPLDEAVDRLQREWEIIRYQTPAGERARRYEALAARAHQLGQAHVGRPEPLVCEGQALSSWAAERGGFGGLSIARHAKALYEQAIRLDDHALGGAAYEQLGMLYHRVPRWPIGFGDEDHARELLEQALSIDPQALDANWFYAEFLAETGHPAEAVPYLEKVIATPSRPGRQVGDAGRREQARALLAKVRAN